MKEKRKILLGSEGIIDRDNDDIFLNVTLTRSFNEIEKERFDNNFNVADQFRKERNLSRNFCVYGQVDSTVSDCDNLQIYYYGDASLTDPLGLVTTTSIALGGKNVFGFKRGKYVINLVDYQYEFIYIVIKGTNNFGNQLQVQQLVFIDRDGVLIDYGNETVEITQGGNILVVENNFPFFYDKHWVDRNVAIDTNSPVVTALFTFLPTGGLGNSLGNNIL